MEYSRWSVLNTLLAGPAGPGMMPKFEFELTKIGPSAIASVASFVATIFLGGMIWAQLTGEQERLRRDVDQARIEINLLRAYDTSIALLKNDVVHIRDSVQRIEQRLKPGN